jgi:hypothetical protein
VTLNIKVRTSESIHEGLCESKFGYGGYMWRLNGVQKVRGWVAVTIVRS